MTQRRIPALLTLLATGTVPVLRAQVQATPDLGARLAAIVDAPEFRGATWGLLIVDRATGAVLHERNADLRLAPASVTKLFSCAAALVGLGADHRVETRVLATGPWDADGRLPGPLILVAAGDPTLGGRGSGHGPLQFRDVDHTYAAFNDDGALVDADPLAGLDELARQVQAKGIRHVADVVVDDRLWNAAEGSGSGPSRLSPIVVNDNVVDLVVRPAARAGDQATVEMRPQCDAVTIDARITTVEPGRGTEVGVRRVGPGRVSVRGRIEAGRAPLLRIVEVDDPAAFARALFMARLRANGVGIAASHLAAQDAAWLPTPATQPAATRSGDATATPVAAAHRVATAESEPIARLPSATLAQELRVILKVSHNLHAGMLPLLLAVDAGQRDVAAGLRRAGEILRELGVDTSTISFAGASGGTPSDFVTARATVALLRAMSRHKDADVYRQALPVLGVDGTLAKVVDPGSPAHGRVQAKTGTLVYTDELNGRVFLRSKALAGYATTSAGREFVFAFFVNNAVVARPADMQAVGRTLGRLCEEMVAPER